MNDECIGTKANGLHVVCCMHVCCTVNYYICHTDPILRIMSLNRRSRLTTGCLADVTKKLNSYLVLPWHGTTHGLGAGGPTFTQSCCNPVLYYRSPSDPVPLCVKWWENFLLQGQISVLTYFDIHSTPMLLQQHIKKAGSYCQKCQWQVTAKHTCTLRTWFCVKCHSRLVHGYMVHTERVRVNRSFT